MRVLQRFGAMAIAILAPLGAVVQAQGEQTRARALFVNKQADAIRIVILKNDGGVMAPADPSQTFREGDQIRISFESNFRGYVYIVNVTPKGEKRLLFPYPEETRNEIVPNRQYYLPSQGVFEFDDEQGTEVLQVIMSKDRVPYLDAGLSHPEGIIGDTASSAATELAGTTGQPEPGISDNKLSTVLPTGTSGVRARSLTLEPGRDKESEGSVVAIADSKGPGKLDRGDVAVFEIRLRHQ